MQQQETQVTRERRPKAAEAVVNPDDLKFPMSGWQELTDPYVLSLFVGVLTVAFIIIKIIRNMERQACPMCRKSTLTKTGLTQEGEKAFFRSPIRGGDLTLEVNVCRYKYKEEYKCSSCGFKTWKEESAEVIGQSTSTDLTGVIPPWTQLSREIDAEFVQGARHAHKVVAKVKEWTITLDLLEESQGYSSSFKTRIRAPYVNKDGFRFEISPKGFSIGLGKLFGAQHVKVGDPYVDRHFIIKANDESKVRVLLTNPRIRELLVRADIYVKAQKLTTPFGVSAPKGSDELYWETDGAIQDVERLKSLFELFEETLNQLVHMGSASEEPPIIPSEPSFVPL